MNMNEWRAKLMPYQHRIIITAVALALGILLLTIGFWRTLLLAIVVFIGYLIGSKQDGTLGRIVGKVQGWLGSR